MLEADNDSCPADDAFVQRLTGSQGDLRAFIIGMTPNKTDADDLLQQVNLALWRKRSAYDPGQAFLRWAFAFAALEIRSYRSKSANRRMWFNDGLLETVAESWPHESLYSEERRDALAECVSCLKPEERQFVAEYYSHRSTVQELATQSGKPLSTVYKTIARARVMLRNCVERKLSHTSHPA
ncbi:RNA polymerase sigma factor [Botrimarina colliarenosi]|uniref:RNA polymerase sigma factor n=1 Tax=Botrimarina colliarenosi TaxID=2528001 RepID=A0A5C5ZVW7_9BACT|nr:sigma-70 family RNA polymerase sigma factor [Botrimarina colliarenosi]TWT91724.1 RNA polymerase sigma factor [Botrimarina colliarenosi]